MNALNREISELWRTQGGKRSSKYAYVYRELHSKAQPWIAKRRKHFHKIFSTEDEAGEYVANQVGCKIEELIMPDWDESKRRVFVTKKRVAERSDFSSPIAREPERKKFSLGKPKRRVLQVRIRRNTNPVEKIHSGKDLVSSVREQNSAGYEEMQNRGAI